MAKVDLLMPKMGESIMEATILKWVKKVGDKVEADETILEIATDKVDSEIPSPVSGTIAEIRFPEDAVVQIGTVIAVIATEGEEVVKASPAVSDVSVSAVAEATALTGSPVPAEVLVESVSQPEAATHSDERFYSPLVKNIAKEENISLQELSTIPGSGANGRVTKKDILDYVAQRGAIQSISSVSNTPVTAQQQQIQVKDVAPADKPKAAADSISFSGNTEIVEMDRMRRIIAEHMVMSKQTSPHVTSYVEADVTNLFNWRERNKLKFKEKFGENITFTPLFIDAVVRAIKDFPMINISLDGTRIIIKKDINIGMAAALPSGNLIVPVIKNADLLNLTGLTRSVNDLARRARENKLKPEEIKDGTFTITNVGTFGNVMGTPIINQPQVAILATGAIRKKPAVLETEYGDVIAVRQMMFLSLSYDHRIVDGALGGSFLRRIADYLEQFDSNMAI